jgi:BirA family transcriptional regulator, biotin operon repressor / biotin---[acetyl-CoA-carboxylase] ligase
MNFILRHVPSTTSTMDMAREMAIQAATAAKDQAATPTAAAADAGPQALIVLADRQTAGRGRLPGRAWSGKAGSSLLATMGFRGLPSAVEAFPLRVGLAVAETLSQEFSGLEIQLKWPNDLLVPVRKEDGRIAPNWLKLGGILCEASGGWLFAGIGVNLLRTAYPGELRSRATSVEEALGRAPGEGPESYSAENRMAMALKIGTNLAGRLEDKGWREAYLARMWSLGEEVEFLEGHPLKGELRRGRVRGVTESGSLILDTGTESLKVFSSGEIESLKKV